MTAVLLDPAPSAGQIKSRQRVRDLAEVYTHEREVNAMLDLIPDMFPADTDATSRGNHDRTFLEPACGSGNFLEAILRRKLATVTSRTYTRQRDFEFRVMRCLTSIYGIDIDPENVAASRDRLRTTVRSHVDNQLNTRPQTPGFYESVDAVLSTNIVRADTLTDGRTLKLVEYRPVKGCCFVRKWSALEDPPADPFTAPVADLVPVPYYAISLNPEPVGKEAP